MHPVRHSLVTQLRPRIRRLGRRLGRLLPLFALVVVPMWSGVAGAQAPTPVPSPGQPPATVVTVDFEGLGTIASTVTVPAGTAVNAVATLAGVNASKATGTVTYGVYTDSQCQQAAMAPIVESITTAGTLPPLPSVTLGTGSYYWKIDFTSGGPFLELDASSSTGCGVGGQPNVTVSDTAIPSPRPSPGQPPATVVTVDFEGLGTIASTVTVPAGTAVNAVATLAGVNASKATGTVTYGVYTDSQCQQAAMAPIVESITTAGTLPPLPSVTLGTGSYYWKIDFTSGGPFLELDASSSTGCGVGGQPNVTVGAPLPVTVNATLTGAGQTGGAITVPAGTAVTALASLSGANAARASGWVEYSVYDSRAAGCAGSSLSDQIVTANEALPGSPSVTETIPGTYYWGVRYSGDAFNSGSTSGCIATETVVRTTTASTTNLSNQHGYWLVGSDGGIFTFGSNQYFGSTGAMTLQKPVVGITPSADDGGYWLVASDGGIFTFGDATFHGSIPGLGLAPAGSANPHRLNAPIVGMVPSADGDGYLMVGADGGVFAFGDATFEGSCPGIGGCSGSAVAVLPDTTGNGYWLVTSSGHVYSFGDATNYGAPTSITAPVTSAVRTADGRGYWILLSDGTVDAFGDASNLGGPLGSVGGSNPATAIFTMSDGGGYWVASATGAVYPFGDASNDGGMATQHLNGSIIAGAGV